jgi:hypothetical protein
MAKLALTPTKLDLALYAGDGFAIAFTFTDKVTGEPWPLDGEWLAQVRVVPGADAVVASFTVATTAPGSLTASLTGDDTRAVLEAGALTWWDLQQTSPGAEPRTWFRGQVRALEDVSRA